MHRSDIAKIKIGVGSGAACQENRTKKCFHGVDGRGGLDQDRTKLSDIKGSLGGNFSCDVIRNIRLKTT